MPELQSLRGLPIRCSATHTYSRIGAISMENRHTYQLERVLLEMSRAFMDARIVRGNSSIERESNNTVLAIASIGYVYGYMAISSFLSVHLRQLWDQDPSALKATYPEIRSFEDLMRKRLRDVKDATKALCEALHIEPLHQKEPTLWRELNEVLKRARHYFNHPDPAAFQPLAQEVLEQKTWAFPSSVAERFIRFFYESVEGTAPDWVSENTEFRVLRVEALSGGGNH